MSMNNIIFYDGYCALCNRIVRFILKKDKEEVFKFASLQSSFAKENVPDEYLEDSDTLVLKESGIYLIKATAAFTILRKLKTIWKIFLVFSVLPVSFNNKLYSIIAGNRYSIFGKYDTCPLPPEEMKSRFVDSSNVK